MANLNASNSTRTDMSGSVSDYSVVQMSTDSSSGKKHKWTNTKAKQYLGYYKTIPELKKAIDALASWSVGKGYTTDLQTRLILEHIIGWGEDTFGSVMWSMIVCKKI